MLHRGCKSLTISTRSEIPAEPGKMLLQNPTPSAHPIRHGAASKPDKRQKWDKCTQRAFSRIE